MTATNDDLKSFPHLLAQAQRISKEVAAVAAPDVDAKARFPTETVAALQAARLMSAPVPKAFGGAGLGMAQLGAICAAVAQGCGSSGMVLAMHYIQVAMVVRHGQQSDFFRQYLTEIVRDQPVLASITSEVGTFGDTRSSICAVERNGDRFKLDKEATTGSYCGHSDAIFVTCRRNAEAAASDQVVVMVRKSDCTLKQTTTWDTMGMRGTVSPGFSLRSSGPIEQILPDSFAESAAQTMVPYSHTLWSALWTGIATDAVAKAATFVRAEARKRPGSVPPQAHRLAEVQVELQALRHNWLTVARDFDDLDARAGGREDLLGLNWGMRFNSLKIGASRAAPEIVHAALQIVGLLGYKNDSPLSLGRQYRDVLSAALMISNDRILAKSASLLLVLKDD